MDEKIEEPLVSIAIVTYNQEKFLRECIDSCLKQEYSNCEIVVADDGSTDGTRQLLNDYKSRNPQKFKLLLSDKNRGITKNSNAAHFACRGKYIAWMGGDDLMLPNKIRLQVDYMESNPACSICYHDLEHFESTSGKIIKYTSDHIKPSRYYMRDLVRLGTINGACSTMVRRNKTPSFGYRETLPVASDWMYWVDTLATGGYMMGLDICLGRYRRHTGNVTNRPEGEIAGQNIIDYMNACNIISVTYPRYRNEAIHRQAGVTLYLRFHGPYGRTVFKSLCQSFRWRAAGALLIYIISFRKIKL